MTYLYLFALGLIAASILGLLFVQLVRMADDDLWVEDEDGHPCCPGGAR